MGPSKGLRAPAAPGHELQVSNALLAGPPGPGESAATSIPGPSTGLQRSFQYSMEQVVYVQTVATEAFSTKSLRTGLRRGRRGFNRTLLQMPGDETRLGAQVESTSVQLR